MDRPRLIRGLRIAVSAVCGILSVLLVVLWLRSFWLADAYGFSPQLQVASERGELAIGISEDPGFFSIHPGYTRTELNEEYKNWNYRNAAKRTWNVIVAHGETIPGLGVSIIVVEYCALFLIFVVGAIAAVSPWLRWRYSLRTLLIATTLIAVALGLVAWSIR